MGYLSERVDELGEQASEFGNVGEHLSRQNELLEVIALEAVDGDRSYVDTEDDAAGSPADYGSYVGLSVTRSEQVITMDLRANTVVVRGFDQPIDIAMKGPDESNRWIPLGTDDDPFVFGGAVPIRTSRIWFRLNDGATADTEINIIGLRGN